MIRGRIGGIKPAIEDLATVVRLVCTVSDQVTEDSEEGKGVDFVFGCG